MLGSATSRNIKFLIATYSFDKLFNRYGNYISKLCNLLVIGKDKLNLIISGKEEDTDKQFDEVIIKKSNIDYPKLNESPIKIFDLQKFVIDRKVNSFSSVSGLSDFSKEGDFKDKSIDELISSIDKKIEEIEAEEYKDIRENLNVKDANVSKFRIEDTL